MTETPAFDLPDEQEVDLKAIGQQFSNLVENSIQRATSSTERSEQQNNFKLGVSNLGHCRQYAKLMILQTPFSDEVDKSAAFFGTVTSEPIEAQIKKDFPDFIIQEELVFELPSGGSILGHSDIIIPASAATDEMPQGLIDLKSKAELDTIKSMGRSQQQQFQLDGYTEAARKKGYFDESKPIFQTNVYYDRSGRDPHPYSLTTVFNPDNLVTIDHWMEDVKYAVIQGEDASRDLPREFCAKYCEYFTVCRGNDTDAEGLIEDPELLEAVDMYSRGGELEREGKRLKDVAKRNLVGVTGSTGTHIVRAVEVGEAEVHYTRKSYVKIDIRKIPKKGKK